MRLFIPVFLIFSLWALLPFGVEQTIVQTRNSKSVPAGELSAGQEIEQRGMLPGVWRSRTTGRHLCFGVRFATYARRNKGTFQVAWQQDRSAIATWQVASSRLADNSFRFFCPKGGIELDNTYQITITGKGSAEGSAPTVWLTSDTDFGTSVINGTDAQKGLFLAFANHTDITLKRIIHVDNGAYFLGWLMTLLIGLSALLSIREPRLRDVQ